MKKMPSLCLALLLALFSAAPTNAQTFDFGIVAGLNLSKLKLSGNAKNTVVKNLESGNRTGWFVGPKIYLNTALGLGFDAAVEYSQRELLIETETSKDSETYRTLEIPINVRYNIGLGKKAGVYVATGPQFGFAFKNMSWNNLGSGDNFDRSNLNTTWNIGAGLRLLNHLEIGVGYNFALGKVGKSIWKNVVGSTGESQDYELEYKTNTFQVQLAYTF